jgi:hypothetical protein
MPAPGGPRRLRVDREKTMAASEQRIEDSSREGGRAHEDQIQRTLPSTG